MVARADQVARVQAHSRERLFRPTPARVASALRLAQRGIFKDLWHVWTTSDQQFFERRVLPYILWGRWRSTTWIAAYIFSRFRWVPGNRQDWSVAFHRRYVRSLGP